MIRFSHACKRYPNGFEALKGVSFHLPRGSMTFLTGHSGAGKSTLLKLITASERVTRGQVVIPEEIRNRLGLEAGEQFVVIGEGDVVVLKTLKPPKLEELKPLLDKVREAAEAAGVTPEDVDRAIAEVRGSK